MILSLLKMNSIKYRLKLCWDSAHTGLVPYCCVPSLSERSRSGQLRTLGVGEGRKEAGPANFSQQLMLHSRDMGITNPLALDMYCAKMEDC